MMAKGEWESYRNKLLAAQSSNLVAFSMIPTPELKAFLSIIDPATSVKVGSNAIAKDNKTSVLGVFIQTYNNKMQSLERKDSVLKKEFKDRLIKDLIFKKLPFKKTKGNYLDSIAFPLKENELIISNAINTCDTVLSKIGDLVLNSNDVETLIKFGTYLENNTIRHKKEPGKYGFQTDSENILRYETAIPFLFDKSFILYPNMYIFQTLIVLLLAIVGQLIISDKTVTESL